jgi:uncharacterized OB-fold protein
MSDSLLTGIDDAQVLDANIALPYTLTTGRAAGTFLAGLGDKRILASRCDTCARTMTPAQDYCNRCGEPSGEFLSMPETGTVTAITRTESVTLALIRLDGSDTDLMHRLSSGGPAADVGTRVRAVWADTPTQSMLDLDCFTPDDSGAEPGTPSPTGDIEPITEIPYAIDLAYRHSYGPHYGRLFDELATRRRILGSKCPQCRNVLVPPREFCDICFVRTAQHVDVADTGVLQAFSIIHMEFVGQTRKPPYVYAEIVLDGSATRLIHTVGGHDVDTLKERLSIGMPVRAVWKDAADTRGTLDDIDHFAPVFEQLP